MAEVELGYTTIRAPFNGVIDERLAELGDFVDRGDTIARLVDLDPMLTVTQVTERDVRRLAVGAPGGARRMAGEPVSGGIRPTPAWADTATTTRKQRVEEQE